MSRETERKTARTWLRRQRSWWAAVAMTKGIEQFPQLGWRLIGDVTDLATSDADINDLGAGPLEDFVRAHGAAFIDRIERRAATNPKFRKALSWVRVPESKDALTRRLLALGCKATRPINPKVLRKLVAAAMTRDLATWPVPKPTTAASRGRRQG